MGIVRPRPAIRSRQIRIIQARLADHYALMAQYEAEGMPRDEASKKAMAEVLKRKYR